MRLEQQLYHENLCGWKNCYTTKTVDAVGLTCSVRGPRAMHSFFIISVRDFH